MDTEKVWVTDISKGQLLESKHASKKRLCEQNLTSRIETDD